ncbi:MAG: YlmC/YmxH family sporulation protein [Bacilli bacterium]
MLLSDLQGKDIINIETGINLGRIVDVEVSTNGNIINFVAEQKRFFKLFFKASETSFNFDNIKKIGTDVILIKM